jgi:hypothetical protein
MVNRGYADAGPRPSIEARGRIARSPRASLLDPALAARCGGQLDLARGPLAEESEAYEFQILYAATVLRTLATATTSVTYSAAQQIADWGALLGPGDTLDVRIYQLSAPVGRGEPKAATLTF